MTAHTLTVMRRPRRRTHLMMPGANAPACGTRTALTGMDCVALELIGGATARFRIDIVRELDANTCLHCTRIGLGMLALYASRDTGRRP